MTTPSNTATTPDPTSTDPTSTDPTRATGGSLDAPTRYVDVDGRRLAYRSVGQGRSLVLFNRFRGTLDTWDPAFIDALAGQGFTVITFDYSGLGLSTGNPSYDPPALVKDSKDLIDALHLAPLVVGGWSVGGIAAQLFLALHPGDVTHLVLLATTPPGHLVKDPEQLFFDVACTPVVDLDQFTTIFFEPADPSSRAASARSFERIMARTVDTAPQVPAEWAAQQLGPAPRNPMFPVDQVLDMLRHTDTPILHIGADHDIIFPVENWYTLNPQLPTLHLATYPRAGHGPHHQYPTVAAEQIASFIHATPLLG